ncbi:BMP family protein [Kamptonema animale CS-326]|jgi:basic membrane protein A|uniref:BMP family protein n=1 Tax=Kamptonema animale TaxID=92934 RepID=UPI00232C3DFC|nr:BMP family protein [Kamptonema animale]MDB9511794.1 BMP family protein [Kamptonema animale CS-326]
MRLKFSVLAIALFILSVLVVVSCSSPRDRIELSVETTAENNFNVAVLLPQGLNDSSWNQAGYEGLQAIQQQIGATVAYKDSVDLPSGQPSAKFEQAFREYAQSGYDLILGHGGQFITAIETAAKEFPRTKFALVGSYAGNNINAGGITYRADEAGYLTGVVAALATKTNKITLIGARPIGDAQDVAKFYERGAKAINPNIAVSFKWTGSFSDVAKGAEMATAAVKSGEDVLIVIADVVTETVIKIAESAGAKTIALFSDEHKLAPKTVLTSLLIKYPTIYLRAATLVRQGHWEGKQYRFGFKDGAIELAPFRGNLTPEQEAKVNAIKEDILLNKINFSS